MLTVSMDMKDFDRLDRIVSAYAEASQHGMQAAMLRTGRKLAFALNRETKAIAPATNTIREKGRELGWFSAARKHRKSQNPGEKTPHVRAQMIRYRGPAGVLAARIFAIGFLSRGWLPAIQGFAGVRPEKMKPLGQHGHFDRRWSHAHMKNLGFLQVTSSDTLLIIKMGNFAGPIEDQTAKHGIMGKAIDDVKADMQDYIATHMTAAGQAAFAKI